MKNFKHIKHQIQTSNRKSIEMIIIKSVFKSNFNQKPKPNEKLSLKIKNGLTRFLKRNDHLAELGCKNMIGIISNNRFSIELFLKIVEFKAFLFEI